MTVRESLTAAASRLQSHDVTSPRLEAEVLLAFTLGCVRTHLHAYPDQALTDETMSTFCSAISRRCAGEPLAYITGKREFCGIDFAVRPGVLIPRQETEHLVELLIEHRPVRFADIGTGSGCIAISALKGLPTSTAVAVDISEDALSIARENAQAHQVNDRLELLLGDLCEPLHGEHFEAIVSNPPYVDWSFAPAMRDEVTVWEPNQAVFAQLSGLEHYPRITQQAEGLLCPGGLLAFEVGIGQASEVVKIVAAGNYETPQVICDYSGIERVVWTRKTR